MNKIISLQEFNKITNNNFKSCEKIYYLFDSYNLYPFFTKREISSLENYDIVVEKISKNWKDSYIIYSTEYMNYREISEYIVLEVLIFKQSDKIENLLKLKCFI